MMGTVHVWNRFKSMSTWFYEGICKPGLVARRHHKFPFLRHTYDDLKVTALEFTPMLFQLL